MKPATRSSADDLVHASLDSAIVGRIEVVAGADGLCGTCFAGWCDPLILSRVVPPGTKPRRGTNPHIERFADELARWDRGALKRFRVAIDLGALPAFVITVLTALRDHVAAGTVVSYGGLAEIAGSPRAARAVGTAMRRNPLPLVVPCHRVIAGGGKIGGFSPSLDLKRRLLAHEGVVVG